MDNLGITKDNEFTARNLAKRFFKALIKTVIVYVLFAAISAFLIPFASFYSYEATLSVFFALYLFFVFVIEFTKGTVFYHAFSIANSLVIVLYFSYVMNTGVINIAVEQFNMMVDLRFFLAIFVLGGILGFAKSMLQLLNWMNEREEQWLNLQIKSL